MLQLLPIEGKKFKYNTEGHFNLGSMDGWMDSRLTFDAECHAFGS